MKLNLDAQIDNCKQKNAMYRNTIAFAVLHI